jgi:hypothetical protein
VTGQYIISFFPGEINENFQKSAAARNFWAAAVGFYRDFGSTMLNSFFRLQSAIRCRGHFSAQAEQLTHLV